MKVAILGAGSGGAASAVELIQAGHEVSLWARSPETLAPFMAAGGVVYEGRLGQGIARPVLITSDIIAACAGAQAVIIALPTFAHAGVAKLLAETGWSAQKPIILNPGHTGGALEVSHMFTRLGREAPAIVEFSTLAYVARKYRSDCVTISGRAKQLKAAVLDGRGGEMELAMGLFDDLTPVGDVIASDLANVNMVLHPPAAILGCAWVEATKGNFTFYVEAMTGAVARVMKNLDQERLAVARAYGHHLPSLVKEMKLLGTVEADMDDEEDYQTAIASGEANKRIKAPNSLQHRYYREDFGHGLLPFLDYAKIAQIETPTARSLYNLAEVAVGTNYRTHGRSASAMGLEGMGLEDVINRVRAK